MSSEHWLPYGTEVAPAVMVGRVVEAGPDWQLVEATHGGRAMLVNPTLAERWEASGLVGTDDLPEFRSGPASLRILDGGKNDRLCRVRDDMRGPSDVASAARFAKALGATRQTGEDCALDTAVYAERLGRMLPLYEGTAPRDDAMLLGRWLSGGLPLDATSKELARHLVWMRADVLATILLDAGLTPGSPPERMSERTGPSDTAYFRLPGRQALEHFFNEHVIDVVQNRAAYVALGLANPPGIVLEGPPGCGKTFAVERLVEFLGWPSFAIEAASVASPYIHETSRKVSQVFGEAIAKAPSVVVIDEMDAFLTAREDGGSSHHRTEEVAEFLRRIPEAVAGGVLVIGMTNRKDVIDPAILRRGRFDHVIHVDLPTAEEVLRLLESLAAERPMGDEVCLGPISVLLAGRPLSDGAFVMREAARIAARKRDTRIEASSLDAALGNLFAKG